MNIAIIDLETTSLKSDQGFILIGGIKPLIGGQKELIGLHNAGFGRSRYSIDEKVVKALKVKMEQYDGWITWNGLLFDLPFLDDRLLVAGVRPLEKRFARGLDMMWHAKHGKSTMTSARLDWVAKALRCPYRKTDLDLSTWKDAEAEAITHFRNGKTAYGYIAEHNDADLDVTEFVYHCLKNRIQSISKR